MRLTGGGKSFDWSGDQWYRLHEHWGNMAVVLGIVLAVTGLVLGLVFGLRKGKGDGGGGGGGGGSGSGSVPANYTSAGSALVFHLPLDSASQAARTNRKNASEVVGSSGPLGFDAAVGGLRLESGEYLGSLAGEIPNSVRNTMNTKTFTLSFWLHNDTDLNADADQVDFFYIGQSVNLGINDNDRGRYMALWRTSHSDTVLRSLTTEPKLRLKGTSAFTPTTANDGEAYLLRDPSGNVWHNVLITANGSYLHVYQNGVYLGGTPFFAPLQLQDGPAQTFKIGSAGMCLSDFRVYNKMFTPKEASLFYENGRNYLADYMPSDATSTATPLVTAIEAPMTLTGSETVSDFKAYIRNDAGTLVPLTIATDPATLGFTYDTTDHAFVCPAGVSIETALVSSETVAAQAAIASLSAKVRGGQVMIVSAWIKSNDWGGFNKSMGFYGGATDESLRFRMCRTGWTTTYYGVDRTDGLDFYATRNATTVVPSDRTFTTVTTLNSSGTFHHVVWVLSAGNMMNYVDGVLVGAGGRGPPATYGSIAQYGFYKFAFAGAELGSSPPSSPVSLMSHVKLFVQEQIPYPTVIASLYTAGRA